MAQMLLHGSLYVTIFEASSLPISLRPSTPSPNPMRRTPTVSKERFIKRFAWIKRASFFRPKLKVERNGSKGLSKRAYATIDLEKARVGRTRIVDNEDSNPRWNESLHVYCAHTVANIIFTVKIDNRPIGGASLVGRAYLPVQNLRQSGGEVVERWLQIYGEDGNPVGDRGGGTVIHVKLQFLHVSQDRLTSWGRGIHGSNYHGVPYTFFPQRKGCKVTLYQDAHVLDGFFPRIPLDGGGYYEPRKCWEDIFDAISNARHLIYITGWSVYTNITLVRNCWDDDDDKKKKKKKKKKKTTTSAVTTLGELLKRKAEEGVRVLMLVWDDRTSVGLLKKDGLMATHDEDTAKYFQGTDVNCVLCPRNPDDGGTLIQDLQISTMFTHHQKTLIVDSGMPIETRSRRRRIVSFVGGIDLCDGRYDAQSHPLFKTLGSVHQNDFHQPNFPGASIKKGGPREPWHDVHCKLEGPAAWDVLFNFEQRWRKQGADQDRLLVKIRDLSADTFIPPSPAMFSEDRESWNVQLFRSIDAGAAFDFPTTPDEANKAGLVSGKDHTIDRSIQDAYIHAIRRAKNFIYIENQYFLGSSFDWKVKDIKVEEIGAFQLVPKELSLKIVSKIEAGEEFKVYVVVPMWPEGVPGSASVQAILDWQRRTMEMMYTDIALALRAKGSANTHDLRNYLTFFCLGNRETDKTITPQEMPEPDTDYSRAQKARRFMIYVHAKMMIVDDEYIIVGSANINQRSLDGGRDSEIAMGAYQPYHLTTTKQLPARGQIHGFRMALWYEHLGTTDDLFLYPEKLECMQKVNHMADHYWALYANDRLLDQHLPGHLLRYPISITSDGHVIRLSGSTGFFPDTKASVLGNKSEYLPPLLTT